MSTSKNQKSDLPIYFLKEIIPEDHIERRLNFETSRLSISFDIKDNKWISLPYAPWGSFYWNKPSNKNDFMQAHNELRETAISLGAQQLVIKQPPQLYQHKIPDQWLIEVGYVSHPIEINQHIHLKNPVDYHSMERRKLRKAHFQVNKKSTDQLLRAFDSLQQWREEEGIPLNIEFNHLQQLFRNLPDRYELWVVENEIDWLALCVTIQVTSNHVYYFLPATNPKYRSKSPMVKMIDHFIGHYKEQGFTHLDLGQSSIDGLPQNGLYDFKKRMGALETMKLSFTLNL